MRNLQEAQKLSLNFVEVPASEVTRGRVHTGFLRKGDSQTPAVYGWDNEFGTHTGSTKAHKVGDRLVSNADFLEFVRDRAYENKQFWSEEGWNWASGQRNKYPKFWV